MTSLSAFGWALLAAFCWGFAPLLEKSGLRGAVDPMIGVFARSVGVVVGAILFIPVFWRQAGRVSDLAPSNWVLLGAGGILASIIGQLCFYRALKVGELSRVVPVGASYPVIACLLGLFWLHEPLTPGKTLGILLVVGGTFLLR